MSDTNTYNGQPPAFYPTPMVIGDYVAYSGGSVDSVPPMTTAVNAASGLTVPISACVSMQSSLAAWALPQLSTATMTAATFTPYQGMIAYNTTLNALWTYTPLVATAAAVSASGGWGNLGYSFKSGTLTTAQIAGMYATPVLLLGAPPAGYMYVVQSFTLNADNATAAFGGGGVIAPQYTSTANGAGTLATSTIAGAIFSTDAANRVAVATGAAVTQALSAPFISATATAAIYISNQTAAFTTGGGATGTATWYMTYLQIPVV